MRAWLVSLLVVLWTSSAPASAQTGDRLAVVCFGDADAEGAAAAGEVFADALERFLESRGVPCVVQPALRAHEFAAQALERLDRDVLAREPDLVVWRFGRTAGAADVLGHFEAHVGFGVEALEARGIQGIFVTPAPDGAPSAALAERIDVVRRHCALSGAALLDASELLAAEARDARFRDGGGMSTRAQELLARLVAQRIVDIAPLPRRLPRSAADAELRLLLDRAPTAAARERLPALEVGDGHLDFGLGLDPGPFELRLLAASSGTLRLDRANALRLEGLGSEQARIVLEGELWGGGQRARALESGSPTGGLDIVLRRRDARHLELLVGPERVRQGLWSGPLAALAWEGAEPPREMRASGALRPHVQARPGPIRAPQFDFSEDQTFLRRVEDTLESGSRAVVAVAGGAAFVAAGLESAASRLSIRISDEQASDWTSPVLPPAGLDEVDAREPALFTMQDRKDRERVLLWLSGYPARTATSADGGVTWSPLEPVGAWGGTSSCGALCESDAPGHALLFLWDDGRRRFGDGVAGSRTRVYQTHTFDGGSSWSPPEAIAEHGLARLSRPTALRSPDGERIVVVMADEAGERGAFWIESTNAGRSWSEPRRLAPELAGSNHRFGYDRGGALLATFLDRTPGGPWDGDPTLWIGSFADLVEARPGRWRVRLLEGATGGELLARRDGSWLATQCWSETDAPPEYASLDLVPKTYPGIFALAFTSERLEAKLGEPKPR